MKRNQLPALAGFSLLSGVLLVYLLLPLLGLLPHLSWSAFGRWQTSQVLAALGVSMAAATLAIVVLAVCGLPLAWLLARQSFPGKSALSILVQLPLAVPPVVSGILLLLVFGPYTPIGSWLGRLGLQTTDSLLAITMAQVFVSSPFVIIPARSAFAAIDPSLEAVARTLGKSPGQIFRQVIVPLAWPAILSALTLAWVRALGEFGATAMVAYHPYAMPVLAWVQFQEAGLESTVPLVVLMLAVGAAGIVLSHFLRQPRWRQSVRSHAAAAANEDWRLGAEAPPAISQTPLGAGLQVAIEHRAGSFQLAAQFAVGGKRLALLGPSGSGKTMTLQALAGLIQPHAGYLQVGETVLYDAAHGGRVGDARVGYVPQHFALFPHLTVWENLCFASEGDDPAMLGRLLALMGLQGHAQHYPAQLSHGQQQRVALARALAYRPDYLLLDEPFASLDTPLRLRLRRDMLRLLKRLDIPVVLVTHDPDEAFELAESVVIMAHGSVLQYGARDAVFQAPVSPQVAELLGIRNTFRGEVVTSNTLATVIRYQSSSMFLPQGNLPVGSAVSFFANPIKLVLLSAEEGAGSRYDAALEGEIDLVLPRANGVRCLVVVGDGNARDYWEVDVPTAAMPARPWQTGDRVRLLMPSAAIHLMQESIEAA